ncbi:MAG: M20/M25/M40 family metallo-hydrolase [Phenylobacterium sp.]|uniref:M20/M25/M40 family metallo-hydrolase n=1 Tax=Phenylobacterium sp. TaxID=1871053 RepID=UPI0027327394|nr:M20/M25/M40 family metallo-hydrolase [Phenylobacterium sp.]MDP3172854.1 M20/M25/M40 family metallo-hydrolase [Phenylobacterium sp.]
MSLRRWTWFAVALALAAGLAFAASQTPRPLSPDAPANVYSAGRAMRDIREIAQRPHPVGSTEHARVKAYLLARMRALGLVPITQVGPLSRASAVRLGAMGGDERAREITNLIGVLPGRDPAARAVVLMAHYDTTPSSPGAADDSTGVAAALEAARAIQARGPALRPLIVLLTDAEEIDLDGARLFFGAHPLRGAVGAVVNLEARGGGGRALMFETGPGNAQMVALFARAAARAQGGPSSNSLAVFVYRHMPNGTDFTLPKDAGTPGVNLAFLGRPGQYHTSSATPQALDQGSVQHIGGLALETADALLRAPSLPQPTRDVVYADVFGRALLAYPPAMGWLVLGAAFALTAFAASRSGLPVRAALSDIGRGALDGVWFVCAALVMLPAVGLIAGRTASGSEGYFTALAHLGWMEAAAGLILVCLAVVMAGGRGRLGRTGPVLAMVVSAGLTHAAGRLDPVVAAALMVAVGLSLFPGLAPRTARGAGLGLIGLGLALTAAAQAAAPETAFLFAWPTLIAAASLAWRSRWPALLATIVGGGWLGVQSHGLFLGVGADMPGVLAITGLLTMMLARPLVDPQS